MALTLDLFVRKRLTYQDLNNKIQIPIQNYINQKCVIQDEVSADIAANKIVRRDALGRVKFAAPEEPEHGARLAELEKVATSWGVPVGTILAFAGRTPPDGYLECNGQAVSRTTYAALFAAIGTTWGSGNGSTTFNLPDLRGEFLRGWDHGRGVDSGRALGSSQGDAIRNITGTFWTDDTGVNRISGAFYSIETGQPGPDDSGSSIGRKVGFDASRVVPTAKENRPRNKAVMYIIKY